MKLNRKAIKIVLAMLIMLSMLCAAAVCVVQAAGVVVNVNDSKAQGRGPVSVGGDYGLRLGYGGAFTEVGVSMPT